MQTNTPPRKLRMALIGGGGQAFIGRVHATAATLDNRAELVAGALSSNPDKARAAAASFGIAADRAYGSWRELLDRESELPADRRVDFVSIATPNYTHYEIAREALQAGFHVVCDKPLTTRLEDAESLARVVRETGRVLALTHNYSGYPMVRQARAMIAAGEIGTVRAVRASYLQGWLWGWQPDPDAPRGAWKSDPEKSGPGGSLGDIGTHAYQLIRYVTQLAPRDLSCQLRTFRDGWTLDDYGQVTLRFTDNAIGSISFSQATHGHLNDLSIEVDGTTGSLFWRQESPNELVLRRFNQATQTLERAPGASYMNDAGRFACRLPGGHPEAFFEAFANVYVAAFDAMLAEGEAARQNPLAVFPTVDDGVEGVRFIEQCVASHQADGAWRAMNS
ncbi:MAG: Gfo/Idh/MocA family oxidoreductase [Planctomycetales bacterium]|nr:Gfo/Idh/MocA family oxidoreductase [Planctomycetales bacterium]